MTDSADNDLGAKLTAVEKRRHADPDFAAQLEQDPVAALAELNFTAAEAGRVHLKQANELDDSCSCFGSVGRGCLIPDYPGTFG